MEKKDLKIEFRAIYDNSIDMRQVQYRISPDQDLKYTIEVKLLWGLIKFKLKRKYSTSWRVPVYFEGRYVDRGFFDEMNWFGLYIKDPSELDAYKSLYKTFGDLQSYLDERTEENREVWKEKESIWY